MRVKLATFIFNASFGCGHLPTSVDHGAHRAQWARFV